MKDYNERIEELNKKFDKINEDSLSCVACIEFKKELNSDYCNIHGLLLHVINKQKELLNNLRKEAIEEVKELWNPTLRCDLCGFEGKHDNFNYDNEAFETTCPTVGCVNEVYSDGKDSNVINAPKTEEGRRAVIDYLKLKWNIKWSELR